MQVLTKWPLKTDDPPGKLMTYHQGITGFSSCEHYRVGAELLAPYNAEVTGATGCCIVTTETPVPTEIIEKLEKHYFHSTSDTRFIIPLFYREDMK